MTTRPLPHPRTLERLTAVASFCAAVGLAFLAVLISDTHDIAAGVAMVIAQFLLLTASIFGIDYKLNSYGHTTPNTAERLAQ